jgi:hypothetical protein
VVYERAEGSESRLMRVPATGGTPQMMNNLNLQHATVSPDGRQVAAIYLTDPTAVTLKVSSSLTYPGSPSKITQFPRPRLGTLLAFRPGILSKESENYEDQND